MALLLGAPSFVPEPSTPRPLAKLGLSFKWVGWDGTEWDLSGRGTSGVCLFSGTRGFHFPPVTPFKSTGPTTPGSRRLGHRVTDRGVFWHLGIYQMAGSQEWLDYDSAFARTLQPGRSGTWVVTQPNGVSRSLTLEMLDDGFPNVDIDPALTGWAHYEITLEASQPFWEGAPIIGGPWGGTGDVGDFPSHIASGSTLASAVMTNPGDVEAFPVWKAEDAMTSVTVGVGDRLITAPIEQDDGDWLVIDPRPGPRGKSAYDNTGARRTAELTVRDFAPIPPGASVPLSLSMTGTGKVSAELVPRFFRAW